MGLYDHGDTEMAPARDAPCASQGPADLRLDKGPVAR
jgi:hypothetical protein